jgi:Protein of unknown function, DUF547
MSSCASFTPLPHLLTGARPARSRLLAAVKIALLTAALGLLSACATIVKPDLGDAPAVSLAHAERGYAAVLQRHVNDQGEVDFAALRDDTSSSGLAALESYVRAIGATPLNAAPTPEGNLAHMINAYNALSMYNVIASGIPATHAGWAKVKFFVLREFGIGGTNMSLYAFENDIIRKRGEPRIHFALNCSAVSCPVLPRTPFNADRLDEELERETLAFFARPENLRIARAQRTVYFNEILKFYTADFTPSQAPSLIAYAQRYTALVIPPDYQVAFTPYDWTVADSRRRRAP